MKRSIAALTVTLALGAFPMHAPPVKLKPIGEAPAPCESKQKPAPKPPRP